MKFSLTKNTEIDFFNKESKSNKTKFWRVEGEGVGVATVRVFFFFQKNPSLIFFFFFFLRG